MTDTKHRIIATVLGLIVALIGIAYMMYLRVPSVLEVRPELADVGLVTGLFSGDLSVYLFYNYTIPTAIINIVLFVVVMNVIITEYV